MKKLEIGQRFIAYIFDITNNGVYASCQDLCGYGYYQGQLNYEFPDDLELFRKLGCHIGDYIEIEVRKCPIYKYTSEIDLVPIKKL